MKQKLLSLAVLIALLSHRLAPLRALRSLRLNDRPVVLANIAEGHHLGAPTRRRREHEQVRPKNFHY